VTTDAGHERQQNLHRKIHSHRSPKLHHERGRYRLEPSPNERRKPQKPVLLQIPSTIPRSLYEEAQVLLAKRDPRMGAAKQVSSPLLLSGLAVCKCGSAMTLGTGTGKQGTTYRYYRCSAANRGTQVCSSPRIPEATLDHAVLDAVRSRVLDHRHLTGLLLSLQARERSRRVAASNELPSLKARVDAASNAVEGLLASIRIAPALAQDPLFQKNLRMASEELECARNRMNEVVAVTAEQDEVTDAAISIFRIQMMELLDRKNASRAKVYLSTIVERVEVGERYIRILGHVDDLKNGVLNTDPSDDSSNGAGVRRYVRRYVRRWRREWDSNPR
jgi:site-specific DNA recombinase